MGCRFPVSAIVLGLGMVLSTSVRAGQPPLLSDSSFSSEILDESVSLAISLPKGYGDCDDRYPVLYVLDGKQNLFHLAGVVEFLSSVGKIPELIVVGIDSNDRMRDFTPDEIEHHQGTGGGETFVRFLEEELLPFIDSTYRTRPYRLIFGHSYGGTLVVHLLLTRSHLFGGYIAASPNLLVLQSLEKRAASMLEADGITRKTLFMSAGETETDLGEKASTTLTLVQGLSDRELDWRFESLPNEGHSSTPHQTVYDALEHIFREFGSLDLNIDGTGVEARYAELSQRLGYRMDPPLAALVRLGNGALADDRLDQAQSIFELLVSLYPESTWGHVSLGSVFYSREDLDTAARHFEDALKIDPDNGYSRDMLREIRTQVGAEKE